MPVPLAAKAVAAGPVLLGVNLVVEDPPVVVDAIRLGVALIGGLAFGLTLAIYVRERHKPHVRRFRAFYYLALVITALTAFGESQQLGDPFIVYQLPGRLLAVALVYLALVEHRRARLEAGEGDS